MKKILSFTLPIGIAAFFLWFTYSRDPEFKPSQMWADMQSAHLVPILLTFLTTVIAHWFRAMRWNMLFKPLGYQPSTKSSFLAVMSGYFVNLIIPRAGEVTRCTVLLTSEKIPLQASIGSVIAERGLDFVVFGLITLAAFGLEYQTLTNFVSDMLADPEAQTTTGSYLKWIVMAILVTFGIMAYTFRKPLMQIPLIAKIFEFVKGLLDGLLSITKLEKPVAFVLLTAAIWFLYFLTTYFSLSIFDFTLDLGPKAAFLLLVIGSFGIILPVPAAAGGPFQSFVSSALIMLYLKDKSLSITAATTMYYSQQLFTLFVGGICYLISVILASRMVSEDEKNENLAHV